MAASASEPETSGRTAVPEDARRMFWLVVLGVALYVVLDAVAQLLPPHYSPISQAESDLAVGPYGFVMTINFVNRGLLSLLFLVALARTLEATGARWAQARAGFLLLGVWGVGALLLAAFPTDVPATPVSWHGAIHLVVAVIAFLAGAFGCLLLGRKFADFPVTRSAAGLAGALGVLSVLLCVVDLGLSFVAPHLDARIGGLTERIFLGSVLLWIAGVSWHLARSEAATRPAPV